ncbi:hypothetical protein [Halococcus thailandensis]|uniref:Right handed beta helix domain-containing protein n=1 Tax=Halococcus thailandensis JCM 13552 TaxID=1227457 RepID=M0MSG9_9EURY|nr:hypothetical protein [Halococcus thailandensis]EMA48677.1 hypothetical protein C451_19943 [Halococcus thailandensis JCM 13552]
MSKGVEVSRRTFMAGAATTAFAAGFSDSILGAPMNEQVNGAGQSQGDRFGRPGYPSRKAERAWAEEEYDHYQRMHNPDIFAQQGSPTSPTFSQTKNAVKDYGADPKGNRPVSEDIPSTIPDSTVIVFPPGTYLISGTWTINAKGVGGIVGAGYKKASGPPKPGKQAATFVAAGNSRTQIQFIAQTGLFANVVLDQTRENNSMGMVLETDGFNQIRDVRYIGTQDNTGAGVADSLEIPLCALRATQEQANVRAERVVGQYVGLPSDKESGGAPFFWVGSSHKGIAQIGHCVVRGAADNGLYGGRTPGDVQVKGGKFINNAVSQLRYSGRGSWADGVTLVVDAKNYKGPVASQGYNEKFGTHGIKIERGNEAPSKPSGAVLRNADIKLLSEGSQGVGAGIRVRGSSGALKVENSRIVNNLDCPSVIAEEPGGGYSGATAPAPHNLAITDSLFTGSNGEIKVTGRENSLIRNTCIKAPGASSSSIGGMRIGNNVSFGKQCAGGLRAPDKVGSAGNLSTVPIPNGTFGGGPGGGPYYDIFSSLKERDVSNNKDGGLLGNFLNGIKKAVGGLFMVIIGGILIILIACALIFSIYAIFLYLIYKIFLT